MCACVCVCVCACVRVEMCTGMCIRMRAPADLCWRVSKHEYKVVPAVLPALLCMQLRMHTPMRMQTGMVHTHKDSLDSSLSLHTHTHALTCVHAQQRHLSTYMVMDYTVMAQQRHLSTYMVMDYKVMARQRHLSTSQKIKLIYTSMMVQRNSYHCLRLKCKSGVITT